MNREEKQALARFVIGEVGTALEFWSEKIESYPDHEILKNLDGSEVRQVVSNWLQHLPGESWHFMLPTPKRLNKKDADTE